MTAFGRPTGFLARQVRRWRQQLKAVKTGELSGLDDLHHRLETTALPPAEPRSCTATTSSATPWATTQPPPSTERCRRCATH
ncbi:hypothetical protein [Streptomyces spongiae]|uniref:hypothetical protein n=1 Tax=Streptomyces spongiae TaxID=565072 RepID=UPI00389A6644